MDVITNDAVFGEMIYKYRWQKRESFSFLGTDWEVTIVAKAFPGSSISEEQRGSYRWLKENMKQINEMLYEMASGYINEHCQEFAEYWKNAHTVVSWSDLSQIITLKTIMFGREGSVLVLCDCPWDEHGIAIQLRPNTGIGPQDMFL